MLCIGDGRLQNFLYQLSTFFRTKCQDIQSLNDTLPSNHIRN